MATDIASIIERLTDKSRFLTERFKVVAQQRDEAYVKIEQLQKEVRDRERQLQLLRAELEHFKISSVLAPTAESVTATRVMLRNLISEIDRCIAEIKD